jgi:type IV pilus assembly protein PilM
MGIINKLFFTDKPIIGLDISSTGVKMMSINSQKWLVLGYGSLDLDPVQIKNSLESNSNYLAKNIKSLIKKNIVGKLNSNHVAISVSSERTFSRTFSIPKKTEKHLADAVDLEVDQYIPLPLSSLYIDYEIVKRDKPSITVLLSAIPKSITDKAVAAAESAGLIACFVEPSTASISRLLTKTEDGNIPTVIVDIGPASTDIAITNNGTVRISSSIPIGGNTFTLNIAKRLGITLENAHQLKVLNGLNAGTKQEKIVASLEPSLTKIIYETRKVMRYYNERISSESKLEQLLIVGSGCNVPGIGDYFTNELVMPARVASPWQKLDFGKLPEPAQQFKPRYITVAGVALTANRNIL